MSLDESREVELAWLLRQPGLDLQLVVPGDHEQRPVRFAHAIELEDPSAWLKGGELVLTTGMHLPRGTRGQAAYVRRLSAIGVSGLGFGVGLTHEVIPDAIVAACIRERLPLLSIPRPTPFIAITQAIADRLADQQTRSIRRVSEFQTEITRAAMRAGVPGLMGRLSAELGASLALLNRDFETLWPVTSTDEWIGEAAGIARGNRTQVGISVTTRDGHVEMQRIGASSGPHSWLAIRKTGRLSTHERVILNHAASMLALLLEHSKAGRSSYRRLGGILLNLLVAADRTDRALEGQVREFGLSREDPLGLAVITTRRPCAWLPQVLTHEIAALGLPNLASKDPDGVLILARADDIREIVDHLASVAARRQVGLAIGGCAPVSMAQLPWARKLAGHALATARRTHCTVNWLQPDSLHGVVADESVRRALHASTTEVLQRLTEGEGGGRQLLPSLEVYLRHNGSCEAAARTLGVHRHTMRNRVERIEALIGLRLDVAENRALLLLALLSRSDPSDPGSPLGGRPGEEEPVDHDRHVEQQGDLVEGAAPLPGRAVVQAVTGDQT